MKILISLVFLFLFNSAFAKSNSFEEVENSENYVFSTLSTSSMIPTNLPWPVDNKTIASTSIFFDTDDAVEVVGRTCNSGTRFPKHLGVDIHVPSGTPVKAVSDGVIKQLPSDSSWGKAIVIAHANNSWTSVYWHLQNLQVSLNSNVVAGQTIGYVYDTTSLGDVSHLHFGIRPYSFDSGISKNGIGGCDGSTNPLQSFVNPFNYLLNSGYSLIDDTQATYTGTWKTSNVVDMYTGKGYSALTNNSTGKAVYEYSVPSTGTWDIYTRFTVDGNRTTGAEYKIFINNVWHKTVSVNQSDFSLRAMNVVLAAYNVNVANTKFRIEISNPSASGSLISDAILFKKR